MAVERRVVWIVVWSICGLCLLLIVLLALLLLCCRSAWWRNRKQKQKYAEQQLLERQRQLRESTANNNISYNNISEHQYTSHELEDRQAHTPSHRYRFGSARSSANMYPGYTRINVPELICIPPPTSSLSSSSLVQSYVTPQVVRIVPHDFHQPMSLSNNNNYALPMRDLQLLQESLSFDILVDIKYVDPAISQGISFMHNTINSSCNSNNINKNNTSATNSSMQYTGNEFVLLGNDAYYSNEFLLYTSPLEFAVPGTYVIHAHTVHPLEKKVGCVHEFIFTIVDGATSKNSTNINKPNQELVMYNQASTHNNGANHINDIEVDVNQARSHSRTKHTHYPSQRQESTLSESYQDDELDESHTSTFVSHNNHNHHTHTDNINNNNVVPMLANSPSSASSVSNLHTVSSMMVFAPHIIPDGGEVTTSTPIVITPHERSRTIEQLRYSVDGSYPNLIYNGPFTLSVPPPSLLAEQTLTVTVKAIAIAAFAENALPATASEATYLTNSIVNNNRSNNTTMNSHYTQQCHNHLHKESNNINDNTLMPSNFTFTSSNCSGVAQAILQVRRAGYSFYDPALPAPSMRLHAVDAQLYFDESKLPRHCKTVYQLIYIRDARKWSSEKSSKVHFSRHRCTIYDGLPLSITEDIARVYAWTVDEKYLRERSSVQKDNGLVISDDDEDDGNEDGNEDNKNSESSVNHYDYNNSSKNYSGNASQSSLNGRLRSQATIYDCTQGKTKRANPHHSRLNHSTYSHSGSITINTFGSPQNNANSMNYTNMRLLPPPVICVTCKEMDLEFDDPPANAFIAYTLNNTEPTLCDVLPFATAGVLEPEMQANNSTISPKSKSFTTTMTSNNKTSSLTLHADQDGLHTYRYQPHTRIRVTLMETEGVYITARMFIALSPLNMTGGNNNNNNGVITPPPPLPQRFSTSSVMSCNASSVSVISAGCGPGAAVVGYRYGNLFRRGFFFNSNGS